MDSVDKLPVVSSPLGESDPFSGVPPWFLWLSTVVLSIAFIVGLPLNGATVLIFWRRKKLRHLVNFVLLLDCLSHIILCLVCIPIHLVTVWSSTILAAAGYDGLAALQQVVGNFSNVYSTFLTVSIAILRYRRLCWKKKDRFSTHNAIKWSVLSGCIAVGLTIAQTYSYFLTADQKTTVTFYLVKISLILLSMGIVFFCYIRVSQRVWANAANQEKVMDPIKLKKSRSVHLRATIHSCVQIILVIVTLSPHLYEQTLQALYASNFQFAQASLVAPNSVSSPSISSSSISSPSSSSTMGDSSGSHESSTLLVETLGDVSLKDESSEDMMRGRIIHEDSSSTSLTALSSSDNHFARLIGITINYALLVLGTPMAYIASCHRFREQFTSILFSHIMNSPQNSGCHHNSQNNQQKRLSSSSSARDSRKCQKGKFYSNPISRVSVRTLDPSSPKATSMNGNSSGITRNSISVSTNNTSSSLAMSRSLGGSIKSKSSLKRTTSALRKNSRGLLGTEFIIVDCDSNAILQEQDSSNSSNPKGTPTSSPTVTENGGISNGGTEKTASIYYSHFHTAVTSVESNTFCKLNTVLQSEVYDYTDLGQLV